MPTIHLTARAKDSRTLELPEEATELGLRPGEEVQISLDRNGIEAAAFPPNEKGLAIMREIAELQKEMPYSDNTNTMKLLREARAGAMYDCDPTE